MTEASLTIPFSDSSATPENYLKIEQEPWGKDVGKTTNMQAILAVSAAVYGGRWPNANCGGLNGEFRATVYVYPGNPHMSYRFKVSHGRVTHGPLGVPFREEIIQCGLQLEHETDYPIFAVITKAWIGRCYDNEGNITIRPEVTIVGNKIILSKKVYGSLRIRYMAIRHTYHVIVSKRLNAIENTYQSVAYAVYDGGVEWTDIEAPANFEELEGECGNGAWYDDDGNFMRISGVDICNPDGHRFPAAVTADRLIDQDYCSREITDDRIIESVDWDSVKEECDD